MWVNVAILTYLVYSENVCKNFSSSVISVISVENEVNYIMYIVDFN